MNQNELVDLVEKLRGLNQRELVYVLGKVLPEYKPYKDPSIEKSAFFLGIAFHEEGIAKIDIVAYPDAEVYADQLGPDWGFCQRSGSSEWNDVEYVSNFKQGISPFTGEKITMT